MENGCISILLRSRINFIVFVHNDLAAKKKRWHVLAIQLRFPLTRRRLYFEYFQFFVIRMRKTLLNFYFIHLPLCTNNNENQLGKEYHTKKKQQKYAICGSLFYCVFSFVCVCVCVWSCHAISFKSHFIRYEKQTDYGFSYQQNNNSINGQMNTL